MSAIRALFITLITMAILSAHAAEETTKPVSISPQEAIEAALDGKVDIIEKALAQGYKPDTRDPESRTLLMYAAFNGQTAIVKKLLAGGAKPNYRHLVTGDTPLIIAAKYNRSNIARVLIKNRANPNLVNKNGNSALALATINAFGSFAKMLLELNVRSDISNHIGITPLMIAAANDLQLRTTGSVAREYALWGEQKAAKNDLDAFLHRVIVR